MNVCQKCHGRVMEILEPKDGWKLDFSEAEKRKLRPIAETLAMLDGNAFFGMTKAPDSEWYEFYLPEASALYESNGGDNGWAGEASFAPKNAAPHGQGESTPPASHDPG